MKTIKRGKKFHFGIILCVFAFLVGCVYIDSINVQQVQEDGSEQAKIKAGEVATFTLTGHIDAAEDHSNVRFVVAMLAPKIWNIKENAKMTYHLTVLTNDPNKEYTMSPIPESSLPKWGNGATWSDVIMNRYGVGNNVLNDMEWVAFQTDDLWDIHNGEHPNYVITIKCKTDNQNLRAYLGFVVNHTDDGMSGGTDHNKVVFSEPFTVYGGNGVMIDFCSYHFNSVEPLTSSQDDFVTFSFQGGVYGNDLVNSEEVYYEATAITENGNQYVVNDKNEKTLMKKEGTYSSTYKITYWPYEFFNIPEGEKITTINYVFTNKDGSVKITETDNEIAAGEFNGNTEDPKEPFVFDMSYN